MGILEGKERKKRTERLSKEIINENFPKLGKELNIQVQEANQTPNYLKAKRLSLRHIRLKVSKVNDKGRILKTAGL